MCFRNCDDSKISDLPFMVCLFDFRAFRAISHLQFVGNFQHSECKAASFLISFASFLISLCAAVCTVLTVKQYQRRVSMSVSVDMFNLHHVWF